MRFSYFLSRAFRLDVHSKSIMHFALVSLMPPNQKVRASFQVGNYTLIFLIVFQISHLEKNKRRQNELVAIYSLHECVQRQQKRDWILIENAHNCLHYKTQELRKTKHAWRVSCSANENILQPRRWEVSREPTSNNTCKIAFPSHFLCEQMNNWNYATFSKINRYLGRGMDRATLLAYMLRRQQQNFCKGLCARILWNHYLANNNHIHTRM